MVKSRSFLKISVNRSIFYIDDDHYVQFHNLVFNELLINIRMVPFDRIINNNLMEDDSYVYRIHKAHCLFWLYTAERNMINSITIYSFRFANACNPELYKTFETTAHHLFMPSHKQRHQCFGWYKYIGSNLFAQLDKYLNIKRIIAKHATYERRLFINQAEERLDIQFDCFARNERIVITFDFR